MAQKSLGYVENIWTCPNCGTKNPGSVRFCKSCGAAMPKSTAFEHQAGAQLIKDQEKIEAAKAGADIYCPYCGNRNAGNAKECANCGGDLTGGKQRESGRAYRVENDDAAKEIICSACGTKNPAGSLKCSGCGSVLAAASAKVETVDVAAEREALNPQMETSNTSSVSPSSSSGGKKKKGGLGCILIAVVILLASFFLFGRNLGGAVKNSAPETAIVQGMEWQTAVEILSQQPQRGQDWYDEISSDYEVGQCEQRERYRSDDPVANSKEECGDPYYVDQGNGYSQLVQDCVYIVYDNYCDYTYYDWGVADVVRASGTDNDPYLPETDLDANMREGDQTANYKVYLLDSNGNTITYSPSTYEEFHSIEEGEEYDLRTNLFGQVTGLAAK